MRRFLLMAIVFMASCSKSEMPYEYGNVRLSIGHNSSVIVKSATEEIPATYIISTVNSQGEAVSELNGEYGTIKEKDIAMPVGTYTVSAYNITEEEAETERGAQRFFGSTSFDIKAGELHQASFTCTMENARVSFVLDDSFKNIFDVENAENPAKVTVYTAANPSRKIEYTKDATLSEDDPQIAYFNIDSSDSSLNFTITARRKSDSADKSYSKSFALQKQSWYKVTIKAASNSGSDEVTVNMDATL